MFRFSSLARTLSTALILSAATLAGAATPVVAEGRWPPAGIQGFWSGEGRLALREGKFETVKCRVTYLQDAAAGQSELKQNVRCATADGKIEVKSVIRESSGSLTGTWEETVYNLKGDLTGKPTGKGFRIEVRSADLSANMDLLLKGSQQVIELQFFNSALMGLTIMLTKGMPSASLNP